MGSRAKRAVALACVCLLALGASALYTPQDAVVELTKSNFDKTVVHTDGVSLVEFYAPWCGHCQALAPHYKKVAEKMKGIALVGAVDCEQHKQLCAQYQVKAFPTIKLFPAEKQKNPYTGEFMKVLSDYQGPRTAKPLMQVIEQALTDVHIAYLKTGAELRAFRAKHASKPQVLLFSSKETSTVLYNGLSTQLHAALSFALVHESAAEVVEAEGVQQFPTLKVIKPDGEVVTYDGAMKGASLKEFLDGFVPASAQDDKGSEADAPLLPPVKAANLTVGGLPEVDAQEDMWLVAFVKATAEECQEHIARYLEVVRDLEGVLQLGVVRATAEDLHQLPDSYGVDKAALEAAPCEPQVVLFPFGSNKQELEEYQKYQGAMDAKEVQKWALAAAPDLVQVVTGPTYERFMGIDEIPGMPQTPGIRVFLFSNKEEAPAMWRALAAAFRERASYVFGFMNMLDAQNNMLVQVNKLPLVALAVPTLKDGAVQLAMQPYTGPLKLQRLYRWLLEMAKQLQILKGDDTVPDSAASLVPAASNDTQFDQHCASKPGLCVLCLLDAGSSAYASHLGTVTRLAAARIEQPLHFVQIDAPTQPLLLQQLGVLRSDIPTVVALSPKRMRYAVLRDTFGDTTISQLLDDVLGGRARTTVLQELPKLIQGGAAPGATGTEGEAPAGEEEVAIEEEFDLSDILGEEVEGELGTAADKLAQVEKELQEEANRQAEEEAKKAKKKKKKKKKSKKSKKSKTGDKKAAASGGQGDVHDEL